MGLALAGVWTDTGVPAGEGIADELGEASGCPLMGNPKVAFSLPFRAAPVLRGVGAFFSFGSFSFFGWRGFVALEPDAVGVDAEGAAVSSSELRLLLLETVSCGDDVGD